MYLCYPTISRVLATGASIAQSPPSGQQPSRCHLSTISNSEAYAPAAVKQANTSTVTDLDTITVTENWPDDKSDHLAICDDGDDSKTQYCEADFGAYLSIIGTIFTATTGKHGAMGRTHLNNLSGFAGSAQVSSNYKGVREGRKGEAAWVEWGGEDWNGTAESSGSDGWGYAGDCADESGFERLKSRPTGKMLGWLSLGESWLKTLGGLRDPYHVRGDKGRDVNELLLTSVLQRAVAGVLFELSHRMKRFEV